MTKKPDGARSNMDSNPESVRAERVLRASDLSSPVGTRDLTESVVIPDADHGGHLRVRGDDPSLSRWGARLAVLLDDQDARSPNHRSPTAGKRHSPTATAIMRTPRNRYSRSRNT